MRDERKRVAVAVWERAVDLGLESCARLKILSARDESAEIAGPRPIFNGWAATQVLTLDKYHLLIVWKF